MTTYLPVDGTCLQRLRRDKYYHCMANCQATRPTVRAGEQTQSLTNDGRPQRRELVRRRLRVAKRRQPSLQCLFCESCLRRVEHDEFASCVTIPRARASRRSSAYRISLSVRREIPWDSSGLTAAILVTANGLEQSPIIFPIRG